MLLYALPGMLVVGIAFASLLRDSETPNNSWEFWTITLLAALLWPVTLPSMLWRKFLSWRISGKERSPRVREESPLFGDTLWN